MLLTSRIGVDLSTFKAKEVECAAADSPAIAARYLSTYFVVSVLPAPV